MAGRRAKLGALAAGSIAALGILCEPSTAEAIPRVLRPGTRPWVADIGFGPSIMAYTPSSHFGRGRRGVMFKLMQEIGGHFQGDAEGPALGGVLEESFGNDVRLSVGCKFWWDIKIIDDLGLYLTPEAKVGMALWTGHTFYGYFNPQLGFGAKLMLDDRWMVFLRPITADFYVGRYFFFGWDIMAGGGVTW
jgi:hypothetical protein